MGMSEKHAIAQSEALAEALSEFADTLVTKEYQHAELSDIRSTLRLNSWMLGVLVVTQLIPLLQGGWRQGAFPSRGLAAFLYGD
jgi:hypothetical protein